MSKIFSKNQGPAVDVKRNTFDLSFASHVTGKLGDLIPVYCQEVIPGDSFEIDPKFGLRFNPTVFPIQTKMHGIMHFFYVRNRNLYKDWPEYITRTKDDAVMPYLSISEARAKSIIGTGTIGDYLGVPTTLTGEYALKINVALDSVLRSESRELPSSFKIEEAMGSEFESAGTFQTTALGTINSKGSTYVYVGNDLFTGRAYLNPSYNPFVVDWKPTPTTITAYNNPSWKLLYGYISKQSINHPITKDAFYISGSIGLGSSAITLSEGKAFLLFTIGESVNSPVDRTYSYCLMPISLSYDPSTGNIAADYEETGTGKDDKIDFINSKIGSQSVYCHLLFDPTKSDAQDFQSLPSVLPTDPNFKLVGRTLTFNIEGSHILDSTDPATVAYNPFVRHSGETTPKIKLNALPFRAYESIYNYFYRDETVDPFKINGKEVYNDFIPTHDGGPDSTHYTIHQKNWERDYYTSCQTSPQQGEAPLVGISSNGTFTFSDGTNEYTASATIGDDGETITGISTYSPDMPKGSLRQLMDVVTNGISINDLRNVNSLQRKETCALCKNCWK